ncbi:hypothetical protein CORI_0240 [Campylobacter sp. CCUG 57310]|nr:hypothetical protein CORI_0240 [Campylobacter sp. CCUG 57310]
MKIIILEIIVLCLYFYLVYFLKNKINLINFIFIAIFLFLTLHFWIIFGYFMSISQNPDWLNQDSGEIVVLELMRFMWAIYLFCILLPIIITYLIYYFIKLFKNYK